MLRENTSIAFVVDRRLRVLLWSNGLVEATSEDQGTAVDGEDSESSDEEGYLETVFGVVLAVL